MSLIETPAKVISGAGSAVGSPVGSLTSQLRNPFKRSTDTSGVPTPDYAEGFIIEELLDGPRNNNKIVLNGNMMPKDRFDREITLRRTKDHYPGSDEPVIHILGFEENDITIKGRFYDKKYTETTPNGEDFRGVATQMRIALEEMEKRKNIVRISLGEWRRYALIDKVKTSEKTAADIDYEITFVIFGTKQPVNAQLMDRLSDIPIDVNEKLIVAAQQFQKDFAAAPKEMPASIGDIMNQLTGSVASVLGVATGFIDDVISTGEDITNSLGRAIGLVRYARNSLIVYKRRAGAISYSLAFNNINVPARYRSTAFIANSITATLSIQEILNQLLKRFEELIRTVPLSRHRVITQDSLQKLSTKFYGVPDYWKKIYDHNKLTSTNLTVGSVLEIPRL